MFGVVSGGLLLDLFLGSIYFAIRQKVKPTSGFIAIPMIVFWWWWLVLDIIEAVGKLSQRIRG